MNRTVKYEPFPSQVRFHLLDAKFKGFSGPVGSGKSAALCQEALKQAYLNAGCTGLIGAPTYRMLSDVTRAAFLNVVREDNEIPHEFHKTDNSVVLHECGSKILFRSLDQPERLVGLNLAWFGLDELTYSKEDSWNRLCARLRQPQAQSRTGFAVWTPKGFDWVYKKFIGAKRIEGYDAIYARPGENKIVAATGLYDSLKASYDDRFYRQEVLGEYLSTFGGQAYYTFDRRENCKPLTYEPRHGLAWSLDFNIDPMCSVIAQIVDTTTQQEALSGRRSSLIHVLDELYLPDCRTPAAVDAFLKRIAPYREAGIRGLTVFGDASGSQNRSSSLTTDWRIVKEGLRRGLPDVEVKFRVPLANPGVRDRVSHVCAALRAADGKRRMFIDPKCEQLTMDLEEVAWKRDGAGNTLDELSKADPKRTHLSDALGYLVHRNRQPTAGYKQEQVI